MTATPAAAPPARHRPFDLLTSVRDRGGWVALVDDGSLAAHDGVALTLCSRA